MFCQQCGKGIPEGAEFCNYCGERQGVVGASTPSGAPAILDEVFADVSDVAEDARWTSFADNQTVHILAKVESGGPFELLISDESGEVVEVLGGISSEHDFVRTMPEEGDYAFSFQNVGRPGTVRLRVY